MPQKAIIIDYLCDQNAPSTPFKQLFVLPDDEDERNQALRKLWCETFLGSEEGDDDYELADVEVVTSEDCRGCNQTNYGDLIVGDDDQCLLVTFLEEPFEIRLDG